MTTTTDIPLNDIDVTQHLPLVISIVMRFTPHRPIEETEEYDHGVDGLLYAKEKFDPSLGFKFSTYATWCIRGYILRMYRRQKQKESPSCLRIRI